jgi:hypothetical protein
VVKKPNPRMQARPTIAIKIDLDCDICFGRLASDFGGAVHD